jgi:hypothetical protein
MIDAKTALLIAEEKRNSRKKDATLTIKKMLEAQVIEAVNKGQYSTLINSSVFGDNWIIFTSEYIHFRHYLEKLGFQVMLKTRPDGLPLLSHVEEGFIISWNRKEPEVAPVVAKKKRWWELW